MLPSAIPVPGSGLPARVRRICSGSMPAPSSSTLIHASAPASLATIWMWVCPEPRSMPCCTAFSTNGCRQRNGTATGSTSGAT